MPQLYRYISADSHLEIDSKHWLTRVPEKYRALAPRLVRQPDGSDIWIIGDKITRPAAAADLYGGKGRDQYVPFNGRYEGTPGTGSSHAKRSAGPSYTIWMIAVTVPSGRSTNTIRSAV